MYLNIILAFAFVCCILAVNGEDIVERGDGEADCFLSGERVKISKSSEYHKYEDTFACATVEDNICSNSTEWFDLTFDDGYQDAYKYIDLTACVDQVSECSNNYQCPAGQLCIGGACGSTNCFNVTITTKDYGNENSWTLGTCYQHGYQNDQVYTEECCLDAGKHTLTCDDTWKDGWHGGFIVIQGKKYCEDFTDGHQQEQDIDIIYSDDPTCKCKDLTVGFQGACLTDMCYVTQPSSCPDAYPGYGTDGAGEMTSRKACECTTDEDCPSFRPACKEDFYSNKGYCTGCEDFSHKCVSGGMIGRDGKIQGCEEEYVSSKCKQTCGICNDAGVGEPCTRGRDCLSGFCNRDIYRCEDNQ